MSKTDTKLLNFSEESKEFPALKRALSEHQFAVALNAFLEEAALNFELISNLLSSLSSPIDEDISLRLRALMPLRTVLAIYLDLETSRMGEDSKFTQDKARAHE